MALSPYFSSDEHATTGFDSVFFFISLQTSSTSSSHDSNFALLCTNLAGSTPGYLFQQICPPYSSLFLFECHRTLRIKIRRLCSSWPVTQSRASPLISLLLLSVMRLELSGSIIAFRPHDRPAPRHPSPPPLFFTSRYLKFDRSFVCCSAPP